MLKVRVGRIRSRLAGSASVVLALSAGAAYAHIGAAQDQTVAFDLPSQPLSASLMAVAKKTGESVTFSQQPVDGIQAHALKGSMSAQQAVRSLISGTNLEVASIAGEGLVVRPGSQQRSDSLSPASSSASTLPPVRLAQAESASSGGGTASSSTAVEQVVVSGTRIVRNGYSAPTPVTVVNTDQLQTSTSGNITDYMITMPAFVGSLTPENQLHGSSSAQAGLSTLSLRNLGGTRTLILIDGQRTVASTATGLVDLGTIPQELVQRVDVVTGGASAAYGSDALAGVVNFVLDKTFEGTKGEISGGMTTYGDDINYLIRLTEGLGFAGDRGHLIISVEDVDDQGVRKIPRKWNDTGVALMGNPAYVAGNGQPEYLNVNHAYTYTATFGGVIDSGILNHTAFGNGGIYRVLNLGTLQDGTYTSGGDWQSYQANGTGDLQPSQVSNRIFGRLSYDVTPDFTLFGEASWAGAHTIGENEPIFYVGNLTIQSDNAFIPAPLAAKLAAAGQKSFKFGTYNGDLPTWTEQAYRAVSRYMLGGNGKFNAFGSDWTWNATVQEDKTEQFFQAQGVTWKARYNMAIDAVVNPATGQIVCRDTLTNPNDGCVPFDVFGTNVNTQAAVDYVSPLRDVQHILEPTPGAGPGGGSYEHIALEQQVAAVSFNGEPFSDWAGPVSLAFGAEHRREMVHTTSDPYYGVWFGSNYTPVQGAYSVNEGFVETVVPLAKDSWIGKSLDLNAAVRATGYSLAGYVTTYKVGATWDIFDGVRIRATRSRDIRAPNLSELYQAGSGGAVQYANDFQNRAPLLSTGFNTGNLNLKPETSDGTGLGIVLQPSFLGNFNFSADYWEMDIKNVIGVIGGQNAIDLCYAGLKNICSQIIPDISVPGANPSIVDLYTEPANFAAQTVEGVDFEADYRFDMADLSPGWGGSVQLRYIGTYNITNKYVTGLSPPTQAVDASVPRWRHNISGTFTDDPFAVTLTARLMSSGVQDTSWIQCTSGCPVATPFHPTIDNSYQPGAFYLDAAFDYNFTGPYNSADQIYFNVANVFNTDPGIVTQGLTGSPSVSIQTNQALYDVLGRTFRLGIRFLK